jgi:IS5 family transposase
MTPKKPPDTRNQADMFRSRLDNILNTRHPLFQLAHKIDWTVFEREFGPLYCESTGRPGLPIRLLVGLHFLKHACNQSDEGAVEQFVENPCRRRKATGWSGSTPCTETPTTGTRWNMRSGTRSR